VVDGISELNSNKSRRVGTNRIKEEKTTEFRSSDRAGMRFVELAVCRKNTWKGSEKK